MRGTLLQRGTSGSIRPRFGEIASSVVPSPHHGSVHWKDHDVQTYQQRHDIHIISRPRSIYTGVGEVNSGGETLYSKTSSPGQEDYARKKFRYNPWPLMHKSKILYADPIPFPEREPVTTILKFTFERTASSFTQYQPDRSTSAECTAGIKTDCFSTS